MAVATHPRVQWVRLTQQPNQTVLCQCGVCGAAGTASSAQQIEAFAGQHAEHQSSPTHYGAGDVIAGVTHRMGIKPCTPCEQRRRMLNGVLPRLWRR